MLSASISAMNSAAIGVSPGRTANDTSLLIRDLGLHAGVHGDEAVVADSGSQGKREDLDHARRTVAATSKLARRIDSAAEHPDLMR
jgi:hypothetical protein